jgi:hypothetical protein
MKTDIKFLIITVFLSLTTCSFPKYLPKVDRLGEDRYGSYIKITQPNFKTAKGELIAVEYNCILVLADNKLKGDTTIFKKMLRIKPDKIEKYTVYFAKPPSYEAFIPILGLSTISHGYFIVFSLPVNLIATIAIASGAQRSSSYNMNQINLDQLRMFARYPQGIPLGIDTASIK